MQTILKIPPMLKFQLWALIVLVDFNYSRLSISDAGVKPNCFQLWLEDQADMLNSLASCLQLEVPLVNLAIVVSPDLYLKDCVYDTGFDEEPFIEPAVVEQSVYWYNHIATPSQRSHVQRKILSALLTQVIEERLSPCLFQMEYNS